MPRYGRPAAGPVRTARLRRAAPVTLALCLAAFAACQRPAPTPPPSPAPPPAPGPAPAPSPGPTAACPPILTPRSEASGEVLAEIARARGSVRVIVQLAAPQGVQPAQAGADVMTAMARAGVAQPAVVSERWGLVAADMTADQIAAMQGAPGVAKMAEDRIAFASLADSTALIQAPQLWALGGRGKGQAVAILDTGVSRTHPFLAGRVVAEACFSSNSPVNGASTVCPNGQTSQTGEDAARPCNTDGCSHGTHVAGIAAGRGDASSGVAPDADILAVQVFSRFSGSACGGAGASCVASFTSDQIRALDWVLQQATTRKVASVNMSLGGGRARGFCDTDVTKPAIDALRAAGVATVIASGNDGYRDSVSFPSCISTAVTVGATSKTDRIAAFSNCGGQVDLHAPGVGIRSSVPGNGFATFSGTSMATPHVAGAFAALRSRSPDASVDQIEAALKSTGLNVEGRPRINVLRANAALQPTQEVAVAQSMSDPPAPPPAQGAADLAALPAGAPVRAVIALQPPQPATPTSLSSTLGAAEAAAKAAGIAHIERMGASPMLVVEGSAAQVRALASAPGVIAVQLDRPAKTQ